MEIMIKMTRSFVPRYRRKLFSAVSATVLAFYIFPSLSLIAETPPDPQVMVDRIKATMIYKFLYYVEWPQANSKTESADLAIGVIGSVSNFETLRTFSGRMIKDHMLVVKHITDLNNVRDCDVLFVSKVTTFSAGQVISATGDASTLLIGDMEDFIDAGGMINFFLDKQDRVQFEVNIKAVQRAGLRISSRLLKLAKHVNRNG